MNSDTMTNDIASLLDFLRRAEALKSTLRTTWTQSGRQESAAEHSWRLCLFAMLVSREYPDLDALKVLQLCVVHDLGEAIHGDIPAPEQTEAKDVQERLDMIDLLRPLPDGLQKEFLTLWDDYEFVKSPEARLVKALDKLETLLQQAQGHNPSDFDYSFNLHYGKNYTGTDDFMSEIRAIVDMETQSCLLARKEKQCP